MEQQKEKNMPEEERTSDVDQFYDRCLNVQWDEVKGQVNHPVHTEKIGGHN